MVFELAANYVAGTTLAQPFSISLKTHYLLEIVLGTPSRMS